MRPPTSVLPLSFVRRVSSVQRSTNRSRHHSISRGGIRLVSNNRGRRSRSNIDVRNISSTFLSESSSNSNATKLTIVQSNNSEASTGPHSCQGSIDMKRTRSEGLSNLKTSVRCHSVCSDVLSTKRKYSCDGISGGEMVDSETSAEKGSVENEWPDNLFSTWNNIVLFNFDDCFTSGLAAESLIKENSYPNDSVVDESVNLNNSQSNKLDNDNNPICARCQEPKSSGIQADNSVSAFQPSTSNIASSSKVSGSTVKPTNISMWKKSRMANVGQLPNIKSVDCLNRYKKSSEKLINKNVSLKRMDDRFMKSDNKVKYVLRSSYAENLKKPMYGDPKSLSKMKKPDKKATFTRPVLMVKRNDYKSLKINAKTPCSYKAAINDDKNVKSVALQLDNSFNNVNVQNKECINNTKIDFIDRKNLSDENKFCADVKTCSPLDQRKEAYDKIILDISVGNSSINCSEKNVPETKDGIKTLSEQSPIGMNSSNDNSIEEKKTESIGQNSETIAQLHSCKSNDQPLIQKDPEKVLNVSPSNLDSVSITDTQLIKNDEKQSFTQSNITIGHESFGLISSELKQNNQSSNEQVDLKLVTEKDSMHDAQSENLNQNHQTSPELIDIKSKDLMRGQQSESLEQRDQSSAKIVDLISLKSIKQDNANQINLKSVATKSMLDDAHPESIQSKHLASSIQNNLKTVTNSKMNGVEPESCVQNSPSIKMNESNSVMRNQITESEGVGQDAAFESLVQNDLQAKKSNDLKLVKIKDVVKNVQSKSSSDQKDLQATKLNDLNVVLTQGTIKNIQSKSLEQREESVKPVELKDRKFGVKFDSMEHNKHPVKKQIDLNHVKTQDMSEILEEKDLHPVIMDESNLVTIQNVINYDQSESVILKDVQPLKTNDLSSDVNQNTTHCIQIKPLDWKDVESRKTVALESKSMDPAVGNGSLKVDSLSSIKSCEPLNKLLSVKTQNSQPLKCDTTFFDVQPKKQNQSQVQINYMKSTEPIQPFKQKYMQSKTLSLTESKLNHSTTDSSTPLSKNDHANTCEPFKLKLLNQDLKMVKTKDQLLDPQLTNQSERQSMKHNCLKSMVLNSSNPQTQSTKTDYLAPIKQMDPISKVNDSKLSEPCAFKNDSFSLKATDSLVPAHQCDQQSIKSNDGQTIDLGDLVDQNNKMLVGNNNNEKQLVKENDATSSLGSVKTDDLKPTKHDDSLICLEQMEKEVSAYKTKLRCKPSKNLNDSVKRNSIIKNINKPLKDVNPFQFNDKKADSHWSDKAHVDGLSLQNKIDLEKIMKGNNSDCCSELKHLNINDSQKPVRAIDSKMTEAKQKESKIDARNMFDRVNIGSIGFKSEKSTKSPGRNEYIANFIMDENTNQPDPVGIDNKPHEKESVSVPLDINNLNECILVESLSDADHWNEEWCGAVNIDQQFPDVIHNKKKVVALENKSICKMAATSFHSKSTQIMFDSVKCETGMFALNTTKIDIKMVRKDSTDSTNSRHGDDNFSNIKNDNGDLYQVLDSFNQHCTANNDPSTTETSKKSSPFQHSSTSSGSVMGDFVRWNGSSSSNRLLKLSDRTTDRSHLSDVMDLNISRDFSKSRYLPIGRKKHYKIRAESNRLKNLGDLGKVENYYRVRADSSKQKMESDVDVDVDVTSPMLLADGDSVRMERLSDGDLGSGVTDVMDPNIWKYVLLLKDHPLSLKKHDQDSQDIINHDDVSKGSILDIFRSVDKTAVIIQKDFYNREKIMRKIKEEDKVKKPTRSVNTPIKAIDSNTQLDLNADLIATSSKDRTHPEINSNDMFDFPSLALLDLQSETVPISFNFDSKQDIEKMEALNFGFYEISVVDEGTKTSIKLTEDTKIEDTRDILFKNASLFQVSENQKDIQTGLGSKNDIGSFDSVDRDSYSKLSPEDIMQNFEFDNDKVVANLNKTHFQKSEKGLNDMGEVNTCKNNSNKLKNALKLQEKYLYLLQQYASTVNKDSKMSFPSASGDGSQIKTADRPDTATDHLSSNDSLLKFEDEFLKLFEEYLKSLNKKNEASSFASGSVSNSSIQEKSSEKEAKRSDEHIEKYIKLIKQYANAGTVDKGKIPLETCAPLLKHDEGKIIDDNLIIEKKEFPVKFSENNIAVESNILKKHESIVNDQTSSTPGKNSVNARSDPTLKTEKVILPPVIEKSVTSEVKSIKTEMNKLNNISQSLDSNQLKSPHSEIKTDRSNEIKADRSLESKVNSGEIKADGVSEIKVNKSNEIKADVSNEMKVDRSSEIKADVSNEMKVDRSSEIKADVSNEMKVDRSSKIKADVSNEMKVDRSSEIKADVSNEMKVDRSSEIKADVSNEMKVDRSSEIKADVSNEMKVDKSSKIKADGGNDIKVNKSNDIKVDVGNEMKGYESSEIKADRNHELEVNRSSEIKVHRSLEFKASRSNDKNEKDIFPSEVKKSATEEKSTKSDEENKLSGTSVHLESDVLRSSQSEIKAERSSDIKADTVNKISEVVKADRSNETPVDRSNEMKADKTSEIKSNNDLSQTVEKYVLPSEPPLIEVKSIKPGDKNSLSSISKSPDSELMKSSKSEIEIDRRSNEIKVSNSSTLKVEKKSLSTENENSNSAEKLPIAESKVINKLGDSSLGKDRLELHQTNKTNGSPKESGNGDSSATQNKTHRTDENIDKLSDNEKLSYFLQKFISFIKDEMNRDGISHPSLRKSQDFNERKKRVFNENEKSFKCVCLDDEKHYDSSNKTPEIATHEHPKPDQKDNKINNKHLTSNKTNLMESKSSKEKINGQNEMIESEERNLNLLEMTSKSEKDNGEMKVEGMQEGEMPLGDLEGFIKMSEERLDGGPSENSRPFDGSEIENIYSSNTNISPPMLTMQHNINSNYDVVNFESISTNDGKFDKTDVESKEFHNGIDKNKVKPTDHKSLNDDAIIIELQGDGDVITFEPYELSEMKSSSIMVKENNDEDSLHFGNKSVDRTIKENKKTLEGDNKFDYGQVSKGENLPSLQYYEQIFTYTADSLDKDISDRNMNHLNFGLKYPPTLTIDRKTSFKEEEDDVLVKSDFLPSEFNLDSKFYGRNIKNIKYDPIHGKLMNTDKSSLYNGHVLVKLAEDGSDAMKISSCDVTFKGNPQKTISMNSNELESNQEFSSLLKDKVTTGNDKISSYNNFMDNTLPTSLALPIPKNSCNTSISLKTLDKKTELSVAQHSNVSESDTDVPSLMRCFFQLSGTSAKLKQRADIVEAAKTKLLDLGTSDDQARSTGDQTIHIPSSSRSSQSEKFKVPSFTDDKNKAETSMKKGVDSFTNWSKDIKPKVNVSNDFPVINIQLQLTGNEGKTSPASVSNSPPETKTSDSSNLSYEETIEKMRKKFIANTFKSDSMCGLNRLKNFKHPEDSKKGPMLETEKNGEDKRLKNQTNENGQKSYDYDPNSSLSEKDLKLLENYFYSKNNPNSLKSIDGKPVKKSSKYSMGKGKMSGVKKNKLDNNGQIIDSTSKFKEIIEKYAQQNFDELSQYSISVMSPSEFESASKLSTKNKVTKVFDVSDETIKSFAILNFNNTAKDLKKDTKGVINIDLFANPMIKEKYASVPSVSRILNDTMSETSKRALDKWKSNMIAKMGEEKFKQFYQEQLDRGKDFHDSVKYRLMGKFEQMDKYKDNQCLKSIDWVLKDLTDIQAVESFVVHPSLGYKGIFDCVAKYKDKSMLIEWKHSSKVKKEVSSTFDAPLQMTAYMGALAEDKNYNIQVEGGLVVVAHTDGSPAELFEIDQVKCQEYWTRWLERLSQFASTNQKDSSL